MCFHIVYIWMCWLYGENDKTDFSLCKKNGVKCIKYINWYDRKRSIWSHWFLLRYHLQKQDSKKSKEIKWFLSWWCSFSIEIKLNSEKWLRRFRGEGKSSGKTFLALPVVLLPVLKSCYSELLILAQCIGILYPSFTQVFGTVSSFRT